MSDNELLLAFSSILDQKLAPVSAGLAKLRTAVEKVDEKVEKLDARVGRLEEKVEKLDARTGKLEEKVEKLDTKVKRLDTKVDQLEEKAEKLDAGLTKVNVTLENQVVPRVRTIESCYLSTYERYQSGAGKMDSLEMDVDIIKKVVSEHSKKLEKLA